MSSVPSHSGQKRPESAIREWVFKPNDPAATDETAALKRFEVDGRLGSGLHSPAMARLKRIGIFTAGGDSPGLNAAICGVGKAALGRGIRVTGFREGFRGLVENDCLRLVRAALSGIFAHGGVIFGTGREKPHRLVIDGEVRAIASTIAATIAAGPSLARPRPQRRHLSRKLAEFSPPPP